MNQYYTDLHIHVGRTETGKPVKITGARSLTVKNIIQFARYQKGLDMIGIIDCHSPEVLTELNNFVRDGVMSECPSGGLNMDGLTIILGSELEIYDKNCKGPIHVLCYMPNLASMKGFSDWLSTRMKNIQLSSQRIYVTGLELQKKVKEYNGLFIPAHIFTPFKSLYGSGVNASLTEVFDPLLVDAVELGLSSDTNMADSINELHKFPFLTNSDAHSLAKMAREYQVLEMVDNTFAELKQALKGQGGRRIVKNYGLNPVLGKYHETVCGKCSFPLIEIEKVDECSQCGSSKIIKGVSIRIKELSNTFTRPKRPPYIHQVPLEFIPGLGNARLNRLLQHFSTEMQIIHEVPYENLAELLPRQIADAIISAREGILSFTAGGGGIYGKVKQDQNE